MKRLEVEFNIYIYFYNILHKQILVVLFLQVFLFIYLEGFHTE